MRDGVVFDHTIATQAPALAEAVAVRLRRVLSYGIMTRPLWNGSGVALLALGIAACSSGSSGGASGPSSPFAGQWTCPYTTNSGFMDSTPMVFTANADGTLSSTSMLQSSECNLKWTVSGETATAASGQTCGPEGGAGGFTVTSYTFTLTGDTAMFSATAILHGLNQDADGGFSPIDLSGSLSGTCTRGAGEGGS
jgi:hypothetical protein